MVCAVRISVCRRQPGEDFRLPNTDIYSKDNPDGVLICRKVHISYIFGSGALAGREFELRYHTKAQTLTSSDGVPFLVKEGDFEIVYTKDNNLVISINGRRHTGTRRQSRALQHKNAAPICGRGIYRT